MTQDTPALDLDAARKVLGPRFSFRSGIGFPPEVADLVRMEFDDDRMFLDEMAHIRRAQATLIDWAAANGLRYDGKAVGSCCMAWLLRRSGVCRDCTDRLVVRPGNGSYWRVDGGARTGKGDIRTVPALLHLSMRLYERAERYAWLNADTLALSTSALVSADGSGMFLLYRRDLLPELSPLA